MIYFRIIKFQFILKVHYFYSKFFSNFVQNFNNDKIFSNYRDFINYRNIYRKEKL
jgi:hypothetical protein